MTKNQNQNLGLKTTIAKMLLVSLSLVSASSFADDLAQKKSAFKVDFNKLIDETNVERRELVGDSSSELDQASAAPVKVKHTEKKLVTDFVDVEIGWGESPAPVVDRRFDSVGKPRVVSGEMLVTLVKVKSRK